MSRFYLRRFADEVKRLRAVRLTEPVGNRTPAGVTQDTASARLVAVKRATTSTDFYTVDSWWDEDDSLEDALSMAEDYGAKALQMLLTGEICFFDSPARTHLVDWIALQYLRTPSFRSDFDAFSSYAAGVPGHPAGLAAQVIKNGVVTSSDPKMLDRWVEVFGITRADGTVPRNNLKFALSNFFPILAKILFEARWDLICSQVPSFCTTDSPVTLMDENFRRLGSLDFQRTAYAALPLSRFAYLFIDRNGGDDRVLDEDQVAAATPWLHAFQMTAVDSAFKEVFQHPEDRLLERLVREADEHQRRMSGTST